MKRRLIFSISGVILIYVVLPVVAGACRWGDRNGPAVYPEEAHSLLYRIGYKLAGGGKPRLPVCVVFERRPWFYGMKPRLRNDAEIKAILANQRNAGDAPNAEREAFWQEELLKAKRRTAR